MTGKEIAYSELYDRCKLAVFAVMLGEDEWTAEKVFAFKELVESTPIEFVDTLATKENISWLDGIIDEEIAKDLAGLESENG